MPISWLPDWSEETIRAALASTAPELSRVALDLDPAPDTGDVTGDRVPGDPGPSPWS